MSRAQPCSAVTLCATSLPLSAATTGRSRCPARGLPAGDPRTGSFESQAPKPQAQEKDKALHQRTAEAATLQAAFGFWAAASVSGRVPWASIGIGVRSRCRSKAI